MVPGQPEACLLSIRRIAGRGLLRDVRPDQETDHRRRGSLSDRGHAQPGRRPLHLRRRQRPDGARRRPERPALRQQRRRPLRVSRGVVARWPRIDLLPDESASERVRAGRCESGDWRHPDHRARGVANRLGQRRSPDRLSRRWTPVHLGIAAQRLEQFLPVRSRWRADRATHVSHERRSGVAGEGRRARRTAVLHRARRRQHPENAAAPCRSGRQERPSADRSGVSPHDWRLHRIVGRAIRSSGIDAALRHRAGQPSFHRHLSDARHSAGDSAGEGRRRLDRRRPGGQAIRRRWTRSG